MTSIQSTNSAFAPPAAATGSGSSPPASTSSGSSTTIQYTEFLQLLVQELKNQDPSNPSDPTQYLSQIATFSNVEQSVQTNATLTSMLTTNALSQAEGAVGKTVTSADGKTSGVVKSVALTSGGVATATLDNGKTLTLDSTVIFSSANS